MLKELRKFSSQTQNADVKTNYSTFLNIVEIIKSDINHLFKLISTHLLLPEEVELSILKDSVKNVSNEEKKPSRDD